MLGDQGTRGLPTGTVTFLFTDIEGSTPLWDAHPTAMGAALAVHDDIMRRSIDAAEGHIFSTTGDGFGAVFARASDAVAAALAAQRFVSAEMWPDRVELRVRMGVHTGEAQERDGDYFGPPVNRAARLMGSASGGQIVVSALTAGVVEDVSEIELVDLGQVQLKGLVEPVHVFGVSAAGVDWLDVPLISTQRSAGNLPRPQTDNVGDLADLQRRVSGLAQTRLVTLTGSGGVGKTRAAIEIGWLVVDEFVDGVWMVELAPVADPEAVVSAIAATLSVLPQPDMTVTEAIVDWCLGRRMLLIIDNCEHVLGPVMDLVMAIAAGCPTVTILATSREPLGVDGERVVRIPSLEQQYGEELFGLRAEAADSSFVPSPADLEAIASICDRVDGIPLAIELAAARIRSLSPVELLDRLDDRFRLLRGGGRGGLERHQTLRATVKWSYQLLSDADRLMFERLSVFSGSFDLAAAEAVCAREPIDEYDVVDLIGELVDKSMVIAERHDDGTRYRLLETLRQYGEERLDDRGETAALRDAHLAYFCGLVEQLHRQWLSPVQFRADARFDHEWENLRAAHGWATTTEDIDRSVALLRGTAFHSAIRLRREVAEWCNRTRTLMERHDECASFVYGAVAWWAFIDGQPDRAIAAADRGLEDLSDPTGVGHCRVNLMLALLASGQTEKSLALLPALQDTVESEADIDVRWGAANMLVQGRLGGPLAADAFARVRALTRTIGSPGFLAQTQALHGQLKLWDPINPDLEGAMADSHQAAELQRSAGLDDSWAVLGLAFAAVIGRQPEAIGLARTTLASLYDARNWAAVELMLEACARVLAEAAALQPAVTLMGYLERRPPPWGEIGERFRGETLAMLGDVEAADALRVAGTAMTRHEIVAFTRDHLDRIQPPLLSP